MCFAEGGIPAYVRRLLKALENAPSTWHIFLLMPRHVEVPDLPANIHVEYVPRWLQSRRAILTDTTLGLACLLTHPDAVFVTPNDFWSLLAPRSQLAVTHDALPELDPNSAGTALRKLYRRLCVHHASNSTLWLSISRFASQELATIFDLHRRPQTMPNWIDRSFLRPIPPEEISNLRTRFHLPEKYFLYVGGYRLYKNVNILIRAHALASRSVALPPLVLVGKIPRLGDSPQLPCDVHGELTRSHNTPGSVLMPGFVPDEDLPALYAGAQLFISASLHEGFGFPAVEAMAVNCPVLVSNSTSLREVVPAPHCRFDPLDIPQIAALMIRAASDPAQFACSLPTEYTEHAGTARLLAALTHIGTPAQI